MRFDWTTIAHWITHLDWGNVPGWLSGIFTTVGVNLALYQTATDRHRRTREEQRSQARLVSGWPEGERLENNTPTTIIVLANNSEEPVHQIVVSLVLIQGGGPRVGEELHSSDYRSILALLPPGKWVVEIHGDWHGMNRRPGIEIAFTDREGHHWIRRANGGLEQISDSAVDYYKIGRPQGFFIPVPYRYES